MYPAVLLIYLTNLLQIFKIVGLDDFRDILKEVVENQETTIYAI